MKILLFALAFCFSSLVNASITIEGTVSDKHGNPVSKCDVFINSQRWTADHSYHAKCDSEGRYEIEIEESHYNSIYICDEDKYGKTALEFWGWNLDLYESQTIDATFDTLEVYSLATWASNGGSNSLFASFRPMSLNQPEFRNYLADGRNIAVLDVAPNIGSDSIQGFVDGSQLELLNVNWTLERIDSCGNFPDEIDTANGCYMPMIIAQFRKPVLNEGLHTLKIRLVDSQTEGVGEGITHFNSNRMGFGF
jgi:hypothetical protein